MAEFTYNTQIITTTGSKGAKTKAFCLTCEYEGRTLYACRDNSRGQSPIWARSEAKAMELSQKCGALALWETFSGMFEFGVKLGFTPKPKKSKPASGPRLLDAVGSSPAPAKPSLKVVPFVTPEAVEEVERSFHQGLFDGLVPRWERLETDASEAFTLTPDLIVSCWGNVQALTGLCEAAGIETGRTKSASGLGNILMAALQ